MKPFAWMAAAGLAWGAVAAGSEVEMTTIGPVSTALVDRAAAFVGDTLGLRVHCMVSTNGEAADFPKCAAALVRKRPDGDRLRIIYVAAKAKSTSGPDLVVSNGVAVIDARRLPTEDPERSGRRFERMAFRSIGLLLGLPLCPNPYCALTDGSMINNLDQAARTFCPPCEAAAQRALTSSKRPRVPSGDKAKP